MKEPKDPERKSTQLFYPDTDGKCADCEHLQCDFEGDIICGMNGCRVDDPETCACSLHKSMRRKY